MTLLPVFSRVPLHAPRDVPRVDAQPGQHGAHGGRAERGRRHGGRGRVETFGPLLRQGRRRARAAGGRRRGGRGGGRAAACGGGARTTPTATWRSGARRCCGTWPSWTACTCAARESRKARRWCHDAARAWTSVTQSTMAVLADTANGDVARNALGMVSGSSSDGGTAPLVQSGLLDALVSAFERFPVHARRRGGARVQGGAVPGHSARPRDGAVRARFGGGRGERAASTATRRTRWWPTMARARS